MTDSEKPADGGILYPLDSKPPLPKAMVLGLQHVLTMFGATVAVPLLLGPAMGMRSDQISVLVSSVMLCSGLATLCQVTIGSRLPIIQGVSFSFLAPFFAIIGFVAGQVSDGAIDPAEQGAVTMQYIAGAVLAGSLIEIVVGFSGLVGLVRRFLTPVVIGPVIMLIGLSLFQHGAPKAGADMLVSGLTMLGVIVFSLVLSRKFLLFRLFPILLAVILVWGLCTVCSLTKVFEPEVVVLDLGKSGADDAARNTALSERYRALAHAAVSKRADVLAQERVGHESILKGLYKAQRVEKDGAARARRDEEIAGLVGKKRALAAREAALRGFVEARYGDWCIVPVGAEEGVSATSLSELGLGVAWGTELAEGQAPVMTLAARHPSFVDLSAVSQAPMVRVNPRELVLPWGWPRWNLGFFIAVFIAYLASMIESFGDYHACSYMAGGGTPTARQVSNGIGSEGIGCMITGLLGGFASTSYSENIGLIGLTKVGSRYVVYVASFILIGLGLFAKFGAFASTIPGPVVGGLYCALFGLISAVGIQQLAKADLSSDRTLFIAGFSLFMGLSVPAFFASKTTGLGPGDILAVYKPTAEAFLANFPAQVAMTIETVGKSGMGVAAILGLVLDNLIPGTDAERGIES